VKWIPAQRLRPVQYERTARPAGNAIFKSQKLKLRSTLEHLKKQLNSEKFKSQKNIGSQSFGGSTEL
jgi:hypothetical protein